jgi:mono/diheme cytochrome c family protein
VGPVRVLLRVVAAGVACFTLACAEAGPLPLEERGSRVYAANCTACHNRDPALQGTLGPAIAGSSSELVRSMVLTGAPPGGYAPGRSGPRMPPLPYLQGDLDALSTYLQSLDQAG